MFSCSTGVGLLLGLFAARARAACSTGTVSLSLPGQLRLRAAAPSSGCRHRHRRRPDPARLSQTMFWFGCSGRHGRRSACFERYRTANMTRSPNDHVRNQRCRKRRARCASAAARTGTGRRPGARPRRGPTDALRMSLHADFGWLVGLCHLERLWGSLRYCRARSQSAATAKEVPRDSCVFLRRSNCQARPGCPLHGGSRTRIRRIRTIRIRQAQSAPSMLDAAGPGADRRIAAAVGMQNRERVGRARLAADGDEDPAAAGRASRRCARRAPETRRAASCRTAPASGDRRPRPEALRPAGRARATAPTPASSSRSPAAPSACSISAATSGSPWPGSSATPARNPACFSASMPLLPPTRHPETRRP